MRPKTALFATILMIVAFAPASLRAQDPGKAVIAREEAWAKASMTRNGKAVEGLLGPDFAWVSPGGQVFNKAQIVKMISEDDAVYVSGANTEYTPHVHGNMVFITGLWTVTTKTATGTKTVQRRWSDTWIKGADGQWMCVGGQSATVPAK